MRWYWGKYESTTARVMKLADNTQHDSSRLEDPITRLTS